MYKLTLRNWLRHIDFIILELLSLAVAYLLDVFLRTRAGIGVPDSRDIVLGALLLFIDLAVIIAFAPFNRVVTRGYFVEFKATLRHGLILFSVSYVALSLRTGRAFALRADIEIAFVFYLVLSYASRVLWKRFLRKRPVPDKKKKSLLIVTSGAYAAEIIQKITRVSFMRYRIPGIVLIDRNAEGERVLDVPVVANVENVTDYLCREWVDEVFFFHATMDERMEKLIEQCREMALTIHVHVAIQGVGVHKQTIDYIGGYEVLTANINFMDPVDAFVKRAMDIAAGLVGSAIALALLAVLALPIYLADPGPLLFAQERIGENGRKFRMYKIRSMYMDAEERKAALMKESTHADGMMFKMDFDPRVIGNRILPDGRQKHGLGHFIRKTSLDEFPQFFNVLKGEMSIVGTRPPTPDEWQKYQLHHRARMSIKPGLTGLWQIQPNKDYMPFEEVVALDTKYIANWGLAQDMRIILATVVKMFRSLFVGRHQPKPGN